MTIFNKKKGITNNKFHNLNQNSNLHICMVIFKKSEPNTFHKLQQQICLLKKKHTHTSTTNLTNLKTSQFMNIF